MATKKHGNPTAIRERIAALQTQLAEAEAAEKRRQRDELLALVDRARCLPEVLAFVRGKLAERRGA